MGKKSVCKLSLHPLGIFKKSSVALSYTVFVARNCMEMHLETHHQSRGQRANSHY